MNVAAHAHVVITAVFYLWKLVVVSIIFFYLLFFLYFFCILFRFSLEELNMSLRLYIELYSGIRKCLGKLLQDVNHNGNYLNWQRSGGRVCIEIGRKNEKFVNNRKACKALFTSGIYPPIY